MYQPYATVLEYEVLFPDNVLDETTITKFLRQASRDIDTLTYNRILKKGFDHLTIFQQEIIKEVCCQHASFLHENEAMLKTYLNNYSINGVNMSFGQSWNLYIENGTAIVKSLYEYLCQTGLVCRSFYYG